MFDIFSAGSLLGCKTVNETNINMLPAWGENLGTERSMIGGKFELFDIKRL